MKKLVKFFVVIVVVLGGLVGIPNVTGETYTSKFVFDNQAVLVERQHETLTVKSDLDFQDSNLNISVTAGGYEVAPQFEPSVSAVQFSLSELGAQDVVLEISRPAEESDLKSLQIRSDRSSELATLEYNHILVIPASASSCADAAYAASLPDRTFLRYLTFIPMAYVDAPWGVCTDIQDSRPQYFAGDNRTWNPDSQNYRTSFSVGINWPLNGKVTTAKTVGQTRRYTYTAGSYQLLDTATAANTNMKIRVDRADSSVVAFEFWQSVTNPLCNQVETLGISCDYFVAVERSGVYSAEGVSLAVPNHELYIIDSGDSAWHPIMRRTYNSFLCLSFLAKGDPSCADTGNFLGNR